MKLLAIIAALQAASLLAHAQGTIRLGNSSRTWVGVRLPDGSERHATAEDALLIGAFYGPAGSFADSLVLAPGLATIGPIDGVMINAPSVFPFSQSLAPSQGKWCLFRSEPGTPPSAPTAGGPSATIWGGRDFFGNPNWFRPLTVSICIPEPSTLVLSLLAGLCLFSFRRCK